VNHFEGTDGLVLLIKYLAAEITGPNLSFSWGLMKDVGYRTKVKTRVAVLRRIMNADAYIRETPRIMQGAVNSCFNRAMLCIEKRVGYFEKLS
jgi:hypothetical protein